MNEKILKYCTKCLMPNTRPRITFDEKGVCNACSYNELKKKIKLIGKIDGANLKSCVINIEKKQG